MRALANKLLEFIARPGMAILLAVTIFLGFILGFEALLHSESERRQASTRLNAISHGSVLSARINRDLNALIFLSNGMGSYISVYHRELDDAKVQAILDDLHARNPVIRNMGVAVGYRLTYVVPKQGNERAVGLYYPDVPEQWPEVRRAVESRSGVLSGPIDLVQGGRGLAYRWPIFIDGQYWGLMSTIIDTDTFLRTAFGPAAEQSYAFAIRTLPPHGSPGPAFYGDPALFGRPDAVLMSTEIPGGSWQFALLAKAETAAGGFLWTIRVISYLLSIVLGVLTFVVLRERASLAYHASYDSLTGLANRRLLQGRLEQTLRQQAREPDGRLAVFFCDLDDFKQVNDRFGHRIGDVVLSTVADRLRQEVRGCDTVARLGGDEFVAVISLERGSEDVGQLDARLRAMFAQAIPFDGFDLRVHASIGHAMYPQDGETGEVLLRTADQRMYEDKQARGRAAAG